MAEIKKAKMDFASMIILQKANYFIYQNLVKILIFNFLLSQIFKLKINKDSSKIFQICKKKN